VHRYSGELLCLAIVAGMLCALLWQTIEQRLASSGKGSPEKKVQSPGKWSTQVYILFRSLLSVAIIVNGTPGSPAFDPGSPIVTFFIAISDYHVFTWCVVDDWPRARAFNFGVLGILLACQLIWQQAYVAGLAKTLTHIAVISTFIAVLHLRRRALQARFGVLILQEPPSVAMQARLAEVEKLRADLERKLSENDELQKGLRGWARERSALQKELQQRQREQDILRADLRAALTSEANARAALKFFVSEMDNEDNESDADSADSDRETEAADPQDRWLPLLEARGTEFLVDEG